jgi:hypothetical protein
LEEGIVIGRRIEPGEKVMTEKRIMAVPGKRKSGKSGQVWFGDFAIAGVIFMTAAILFMAFLGQESDSATAIGGRVLEDAETIANMLMGQGYPLNWSSGDVAYIGLTNGDMRLNESKVAEFSAVDYDRSRTLFATRFDYIVFFLDRDGSQLTIGGVQAIGKPGVTPDNIESQGADNIARIERFVMLPSGSKSSIIEMVVYVWG